MFEFIDCNPFFWRTLRARDHMTRARYFQIYYVAIIVDAYKVFIYLFFWQESSAILYHVFLPLSRLIYSH